MKFDSVFSYNHSTFKTTSKKMFLFCFIALLLAGCGSKGNNSTENVNSSESNVNEQTHVQKKDTETPEPFDWNGITVSIPNGFNYDSSYSFFHVGKNNRYGHPISNVLDNLNNSEIYRTDKQGSIMFKIKNNKLRIETCSP